MTDQELRKTRNDPHNPERLLDRKKDPNKDGHDQDPKGWKPTAWNDTGAGKGDQQRESDVPKEVYDLNWELSFGKLTREEHQQKMRELGYEVGDSD